MHPEIKTFWENAGYEIESETRDNHTYWYRLKNKLAKVIAIQFNNCWESPMYFFKGEAYEEDAALRLIKMKAFI